MRHPKECILCHGEHDPEFHAAVVSLRSWFQERVGRAITKPPLPTIRPRKVMQPIQAMGYFPKDIIQEKI